MGDTLSTLGASLPDLSSLSLPDISSISLPEISIPSPGDLSFPSGTVTTFWNYTIEFSKPGTYSVVTPNQFSSTHLLLWDTDCLFCEVFEQGNFFFGKRRRRREARGGRFRRRVKKRKGKKDGRWVSSFAPRHLPRWSRHGRGRFRPGPQLIITNLSRRRPKQIQVRTKYIPRIPQYVTRDPKNSKLTDMSFSPPTVSPMYRAPRSSAAKTSARLPAMVDYSIPPTSSITVAPVYRAPRSSLTKTSPDPPLVNAGTSKRTTTTSVPSIAVAPVYLESYHSLPRPAKEPGPYKNYFYELPLSRIEHKGEEVEEIGEKEEEKGKEERKLTNEALVDVATLKNLLAISRDFLQFLLASLGLWQSEENAKKKAEAGEKERQDTLEKALRLIGILILGSLGILLQPE